MGRDIHQGACYTPIKLVIWMVRSPSEFGSIDSREKASKGVNRLELSTWPSETQSWLKSPQTRELADHHCTSKTEAAVSLFCSPCFTEHEAACEEC
jgi:hypothetical protein